MAGLLAHRGVASRPQSAPLTLTVEIFEEIVARLLRLTKGKCINEGVMTAAAFIFVSKRLQRMAFALLCLTVGQLVLASCVPDSPMPMAARTAYSAAR
jgi:hypothetical protein